MLLRNALPKSHFSTNFVESKEILRKAKYWLFDGTFEKCPAPFKQVYTIVAVFPDLPERQKSFICGIVFAPNKNQATYGEIFKTLKTELNDDIGVGPKELRFDHEMAAIQSAKAEFPDAIILTCNFHYTKNLCDYSRSSKCDINLYADPGFQRWLRALMGSSHLPSEWQEIVVDHLLSHPPELHALLERPTNSFIEYYRRQWRGKLSFINYFYTLGPRTTNGNESYHSSLNTIIPNKKVDFRTAFMAFKESLRDLVCDYLRTDNLTKLKPREKKYVDAERGLIERREEIKALYDSNQMPSMQDLIKYCVRQAYSSVPDFEDVEQDPRFLIQPAEPVIPPIIPQIQPVAPVIPPMFNQQYRCQCLFFKINKSSLNNSNNVNISIIHYHQICFNINNNFIQIINLIQIFNYFINNSINRYNLLFYFSELNFYF